MVAWLEGAVALELSGLGEHAETLSTITAAASIVERVGGFDFMLSNDLTLTSRFYLYWFAAESKQRKRVAASCLAGRKRLTIHA